MPTYICTAMEGRLSPSQKQNITREITRIHCGTTGAPGFFAQVIFEAVKPGNYFVGGQPLSHDQIFVHGRTRAGRASQTKTKLIREMADAVGRAAGIPPTGVWVYLGEMPARQMIEGGHVLPEPGDEADWLAGLPASDRDWMQTIGSTPAG